MQANVDLAALTETWLEHDLEDKINIPGYKFIHKSREGGRVGARGWISHKNGI